MAYIVFIFVELPIAGLRHRLRRKERLVPIATTIETPESSSMKSARLDQQHPDSLGPDATKRVVNSPQLFKELSDGPVNRAAQALVSRVTKFYEMVECVVSPVAGCAEYLAMQKALGCARSGRPSQ